MKRDLRIQTLRWVLVAAVFAFPAVAQTNIAVLDPNNPLAPLVSLVGGAVALKVLAWIGTFRILGKLISSKLQEFLETAIAWAKGTASQDDDHWVEAVIKSPFYAIAAFLIDYLFSIKLPRALSERSEVVTPSRGGAEVATTAAALALAGLIAIGGTGCASPEKTAYRTIGSIAVTVDGAMNAWGDWVRAGKATPEQQAEVRKGFDTYKQAMAATKAAVYISGPEGATWADKMKALTDASTALVGLIESYGAHTPASSTPR